MDSSCASFTTSPDKMEDPPHNDVQEEVLSSKEVIDQIQSQSNEGVDNRESSLSDSIRASPSPRLSGSSKNPHTNPPLDEEDEQEYGCKYCNQKFSNKQSLGGHQNAHKLERTIEKNIQEWQMANSRYLPRNNFTFSLFNRSREYSFNRAMMNIPYLAQQGTTHPGKMPRPLPGINEGYLGWPRLVPGNVTQTFITCPGTSCLENRPPGIGFSTPMPVPNWNFLGENGTMQMNGRETYQGVEENSGLDLTLRL